MVGSMIGLSPHEMTAWLWVFEFGIGVLLVMTVIAWFVAIKLFDSDRRRTALR